MAGLYKPKRTMENPENVKYGVCLWRLPDGGYIQNQDGDYLNSFGTLGDPIIEEKMKWAARQLGIKEGKAWWLPGFRRISQSEWEDQMERLQSGHIPDVVDQYRQYESGGI